jgi:acyl-CoA thioesterase
LVHDHGVSFDEDIALHPSGPGDFDLEVPEHWRVARGATNGGYIAAVITSALEASTGDPARHPRSLTVHYVAACRPGPAQITVLVERSGRSLTTMTARLMQDGAMVAIALAALASDRPGLEFQHEPMLEVPPPEELSGQPLWNRSPYFATNWDYRPRVGSMPFTGADRALSGGWLRPAQPRLLDAPLVAAMADAWIPPVALMLTEPTGILATIDLTVHFRAALPPSDISADDFCFALFDSRVGAHGFWESSGVIWSRNGLPLAQARQLALFSG